jgi:hypothetical protein
VRVEKNTSESERHGMTAKREDILEDYEVKQAMEQDMQKHGEVSALQLGLRFEPEKRKPASVKGARTHEGMKRRATQ